MPLLLTQMMGFGDINPPDNVARDGLSLTDGVAPTRSWGSGTTQTDGRKLDIALWFEVTSFGFHTSLNLLTTNQISIAVGDTSVTFQIYGDSGGSCLGTVTATITPGTKYFLLISIDTTKASGSRARAYFGVYGSSPSAVTPSVTLAEGETISHGVASEVDTIGGNFTGRVADIYFIDGQGVGDTTPFIYAGLPVAYTGSVGATGYHLDFSDPDDLLNDVSGAGNDFVSPTSASKGSPLAVSSYIGDLNSGGGHAAAFDGNPNKSWAAGANNATGADMRYVGADFSASPQKVWSVKVTGSNDQGYISGGDPGLNILTLLAKNSAPSGPTDGTILGGGIPNFFTDTSNETAPREIVSSNKTTSYSYIFVQLWTLAGSNAKGITQVTIYGVADTALIDGDNQVTPYL